LLVQRALKGGPSGAYLALKGIIYSNKTKNVVNTSLDLAYSVQYTFSDPKTRKIVQRKYKSAMVSSAVIFF
jgi:hypothetical protein